MKVYAVYQAPLRTADPDDTLADAADRMAFFEVGALAVFDSSGMIGIITERDLIRAIAIGEETTRTRVRDYMTAGPSAINLGDDLSEAAEMMVALGTRHLPVVERGEVVGMISARDILNATTVGEPSKGRKHA